MSAVKPLPCVVHAWLADLPDRAAWLEARRAGLGSSDAPAIVGLDDYKSPYHVYVDKLGELPEDEAGDAAEWGHRLERVVADKAAEELDVELLVPEAMYRHAEHEWLLASPDFFIVVDGRLGLVEVKTTSHWREDEWHDGPPPRVRVQVQHQHLVLGTEKGWIACLIDGRRFGLFECDRDQEDIDAILAIEQDFWAHVVNRTPPAIDGSDSTREAIEALYRFQGDSDVEVELPADALDWWHEIRRIDALVKDLKTEREEWANKLKASIGEGTVGVLNGERIATWKPQDRDGYYVKPTSLRPLRLSKAPS